MAETCGTGKSHKEALVNAREIISNHKPIRHMEKSGTGEK